MNWLEVHIGDVVGYVDRAAPQPSESPGPTWWHIVITEPAREKSTLKRIEDLDLKPYLPLIHRRVAAGRHRVRDVEVAMFPCYLFVPLQLSPAAWRKVRAVRGVREFMLVDHDRPALLKDELIEAIKWEERGLDAKRLQRMTLAGEAPFKLKDQVWVKDMLPFTTLLGKVDGYDERGRVQVLLDIEILGRKLWPIEPHLLQLIEA